MMSELPSTPPNAMDRSVTAGQEENSSNGPAPRHAPSISGLSTSSCGAETAGVRPSVEQLRNLQATLDVPTEMSSVITGLPAAPAVPDPFVTQPCAQLRQGDVQDDGVASEAAASEVSLQELAQQTVSAIDTVAARFLSQHGSDAAAASPTASVEFAVHHSSVDFAISPGAEVGAVGSGAAGVAPSVVDSAPLSEGEITDLQQRVL